MELKVKLLREGARLPTYGSQRASGLDLYAPEKFVVPAGDSVLVPLGIAIEVPAGYEAQIRPRSSVSRTGVLTHFGTIDSDYRGEIMALMNGLEGDVHFNAGERIAQLVIAPVERMQPTLVDELTPTTRGSGGLGSTGK